MRKTFEVFCEQSKNQIKKGHKAFYDLTVWMKSKYGSKVGSYILHQEISATACPAKSVKYFGSVSNVKKDINSNANTTKTHRYVDLLSDFTDDKPHYITHRLKITNRWGHVIYKKEYK